MDNKPRKRGWIAQGVLAAISGQPHQRHRQLGRDQYHHQDRQQQQHPHQHQGPQLWKEYHKKKPEDVMSQNSPFHSASSQIRHNASDEKATFLWREQENMIKQKGDNKTWGNFWKVSFTECISSPLISMHRLMSNIVPDSTLAVTSSSLVTNTTKFCSFSNLQKWF